MSVIDYFGDKIQGISSLMNFEWISTVREGDTGSGATWEHVLDIKENNNKGADENFLEQKAKRETSNCKVTLFTMAPTSITGPHIVDLHGYKDSKGRLAFKKDCPGPGLNISQDLNFVYVEKADTPILYWEKDDLAEKVMNKIPRLCIASAQKKKINGVEHFRYSSATIYTGFNLDNFYNSIGDTISVSFRAHREIEGGIRDRGTAFRMKQSDFAKLYTDSYTVSFNPDHRHSIDSILHRKIHGL